MKKRSAEYWKERFAQIEKAEHSIGQSCFADIDSQYKAAQKAIEADIDRWYRRFAENNEISLTEARRWLTGKDLKEFKWDVHEYIQHGEENAVSQEWMKELENASARFHISRLDAMKLQLQQHAEVLFGNQRDSIDAAMRKVYEDDYYHTAYEIQKGIGVGWDFGKLDERRIEKVINKPWAADGRNFSDRIWANKQKLIEELQTTFTQGVILGKDPQKTINEMADRLRVSKSNAGRLVMTEQAAFASAAQQDCYKDLGVEEYEIVATLDNHTSDICQAMDGQHFKMSEYEVGITAPPFHVWCRSTTVPYFDDEWGRSGERAARDEEGRTYTVPADTTYKEWQKAFVKNETEKESFLRNNLPRGYIDERHIGKPISKERLLEIKEKANRYNIRFGANPDSFGNFEMYCGDPDVLESIVNQLGTSLENAKKAGLLDQSQDLILKYDNVLGYKGDHSKIDIGAFAMTKGKTITLNKFMFDDSGFLDAEYKDAVGRSLFASGTSYKNIVDHELGHIIEKQNKTLLGRLLTVLQQEANNVKIPLDEYIMSRVSAYSVNRHADGTLSFEELIAELHSVAKGDYSEFAISLFRKVGIRI